MNRCYSDAFTSGPFFKSKILYIFWSLWSPSSQSSSPTAIAMVSFQPTNQNLHLYVSVPNKQWHPTPVLLPWKSHGRRNLAGCRTRLSDFTFTFHFSCIGEGNGNPLQCSCLENPRDRGAWWAAVYGVAQSSTWLKWLSSSNILLDIKIYHKAVKMRYNTELIKVWLPAGHISDYVNFVIYSS